VKVRAAGLALSLAIGCGRAHDANQPAPEDSSGESPTEVPTASQEPDEPPVVVPTTPAMTPGDRRYLYISNLLKSACGGCHNATSCPGGLCDIGDLGMLFNGGWIVPGDPDASSVYQYLSNGHGPPSNGGLDKYDIRDIERYILDSKPPDPPCQFPFPTWDQLFAALEQDILSLPAEARPFARYLTLSNNAGAGACASQLAAGREALDKLINSISQGPEVRRATPIADAAGSGTLFRIDLRDYALDASHGPFFDGSSSHGDGWEALVANNDYAVEFTGPNADVVILQSTTSVPVMFVDSVIAEASVGDLYAGLLRLGGSRQEVLSSLALDAEAGLGDGSAQLAAIIGSDVSPFSRVAVRHQRVSSEAAYYYDNFELDRAAAGTGVLGDPFAFRRGAVLGSEALFSLPNGFQAFLSFDGVGGPLEVSPMLVDTRQSDAAMRNAISCFGCHAQGPSPMADAVRDFALSNEMEAREVWDVPGLGYQAVLDLYSGEFAGSVASDASAYQSALARAGVTASAEDPITRVFLRFDEDIRLADLAGDLLMSAENLGPALTRLSPLFSGLARGFATEREDASALYAENLCILLVDTANKPATSVCAAFGL
jgi:hypothetical protein